MSQEQLTAFIGQARSNSALQSSLDTAAKSDEVNANYRQYVDVTSTWNDQGFLSIAYVQLPPGWGVAGEHEGQTIVTGPKGENLYVGETYDNDFVEFTSLSPF